MSKVKRLVAVLLSAVMIFGTVSASASAAYNAYLDSAIINQYNSIDRVELTTAQKASLLLDDLDVMLVKEDLVIDIPLIGTIDLTSTDKALNSIYDLTGNWLFGRLTVGDLVILETHRDNISTVRRTTDGKTDLDVIASLVTYLSNCAPTLVGMVNSDFSWGIVKGFLPPEFRVIIDDIDGFIYETIWDALHPVNDEAMPENLTLDTLVQFMCDNQLGAEEGGARAEAMGFAGVMPGFTLDIDNPETDAYRAFEEGIYQALNAFIVPLLNNELKDVITDAVGYNTEDGGHLADIINVNYNIPGYTFDRTKGLMEQLNDMFGEVVDLMLIPYDDRPEGTPYTFEWNTTLGDGQTTIDLLKANLHGVISMIIKAGGEADFDPDEKTLQEIGDYIARIAVDEFVKHMTIPKEATMEEVAYLGLRELCASIIPEQYYELLDRTTTSDAQYRAAIIEIAADLGTYYLNNNIGLNCEMSTDSAGFLSAFVDWCMPYVNDLFDETNLAAAEDGWEKLDAILWEIIPKNWIPYAEMFETTEGAKNGTDKDLTFNSLLNYFLDVIFYFDVDALNVFFKHNAESDLDTLNVRQFFINWIADILNGAFYTLDDNGNKVNIVDKSKLTTFDSIINPITNATDIICGLLKALAQRTELQTTVINLVTMLMGLADPQSLGDVDMDIGGRLNCTSGSVNTTLRISNRSEGLNSAWKNADGVLAQDKMYEIELVSLTNTAGLTASVTAGQKIPANGYVDVAVTGTVAATTEARFDLSYYILDEAGARINDGTPLVSSVYSHLYTETSNYDAVSAEVSVQNVTFDEFSTYLYTTDVYNASLFSILATNALGLWNNGSKDVVKAIVTGALPTGISANAPTDGSSIVTIDNATLGVDSYGTVNPYVANIDPDLPQPYGIYDVDIQFEVKTTGSSSSGTTAARDHVIVIYNDFGLPGVLENIMDENRQRGDYLATADAEWEAYQSAVSAGYALVQGNPDHSKMFADVNNPDGTANAYSAAITAIEAAVAALDAKAKPTDAEKLAALKAVVDNYAGVDREDYLLYTYDRFKDAYNHAKGLVDSQTAPAGEEATYVVPSIPAFDLVYAKNQLSLWGGRLLKKPVTTDYLEDECDAATELVDTNYAPDTYADVATYLSLANTYINDTTGTVLQSQVNATRVNLMEAMLALKIKYLEPVEDTSTVINSFDMLIYGIEPSSRNISSFVTPIANHTVECVRSGSYIGTGSTVTVYNSSDEAVATYTVLLYGDINGDGEVTPDDAVLVNAYIGGDTSVISNGNIFFRAADVNFNGVVDSTDRNLISAGTVSQVPTN